MRNFIERNEAILENINISHGVGELVARRDAFLNIVSLNARSIRNKTDDIEIRLQSMGGIDVVCMTETHLKPEEIDAFSLQNFEGFHSCRINRPGGGGGASIFVREGLNANLVFEYATSENNIIKIKLIEHNFFIVCLYRTADTVEFYQTMENLSITPNTLFVGDANLNLLDLENTTVNDYVELMHSSGFVFLNRIHSDSVTRVASGTIIDHFLINNFRFDFKLIFDDQHRLDHRIGLLTIKTNRKPSEQNQQFIKTIIDHTSIIRNKSLVSLQNATTFDELINKLSEILKSNTQTIELTKKKTGQKPWMTQRILEIIKERDKNYRKHIKYTNNTYWERAFIITRNLVQDLVRDRQLEYYSARICEFANDPTRLWEVFNEIIFNKPRKLKTVIPALKVADILITNEKDIAYTLNQHFASAAESVLLNMPDDSYEPPNYTIEHPFTNTLVTHREIEKALNELKPKAAVGIDEISTKTLKIHKENIIPPLTRLINEHLSNGTFPQILKKGKITPIHKSGDKLSPDNYRPISVLPVFSKIFEKIIYWRFTNFLEINKIIHPNQFGFMKESSTLSATLQLTSIIREKMDKYYVSGLFIDLSKAFDCMDHTGLMNKIYPTIGMNPFSNVIGSFLSHRTQIVSLGNTKSTETAVTRGVPQGSLVSPPIFNFFMNDVFRLPLKGTLLMYADDMALIYSSESAENLKLDMEYDLKILHNWLNANKLAMNVSKTKYILFKSRRMTETVTANFSIRLNFNTIDRVSEYKYLGLIIDDKLTFEAHIRKIRNKITPISFALRRTTQLIDEKSKWMIYNAHVASHLLYLLPIWGAAGITRMREMSILQNRCIKNLMRLHWRHPTKQLYKSTILPMVVLTQFQTLLLVYKIKNNLMRHNIQLKRASDIHAYQTRHRNNFYIHFTSTTRGQKCVLSFGLALFNGLPMTLKEELSISKFKIRLREYLFAQWLAEPSR
jgi:Reverse transcriptase (RNA-dependent DNA polymerase)